MIKKVTLYCGDKKCCPVVTFNKKSITLMDDFGGKVKLTHEQANQLLGTLLENKKALFIQN